MSSNLQAQTPQRAHLSEPKLPAQTAITLDPLTDQELAAQAFIQDEKTSKTPASFREFGTVEANQVVEPKRLTLRFATAAKLTRIESTPDFQVEQGGTCLEGNSYPANATCTLMLRFTPQGPGRRTAQLAISSTASEKPFYVGIGGFGSAPAISFTPSIISTVPGTFVNGFGVLAGASNLAVDNGDALYVADTANKIVRYLGSNGTLQTLYLGEAFTDPQGIAVDSLGTIYISQDNPASLDIIPVFGESQTITGGSASCPYGVPCSLVGAYLYGLGELTKDPNGNVFLASLDSAAASELINADGFDYNYIPLGLEYSYSNISSGALPSLAVDASDTIYSYFTYANAICVISATPYSAAAANKFTSTSFVAGGGYCGFSGDGGQARGALIGEIVSQMTFDNAGNLYFSDTLNQRVRRIDGLTGIISTIAGNGTAGYYGDNGPATSAALNTPTGVAVDSQGQVYILSSSATTGTAQVIRKVGTVGALSFGPALVGTPLAAQTITLANTGNSPLDFTHVGLSSGSATEFAMDPNTTSCNFTVPLQSGRSCKIGFIFNPAATGARTAVLSITDDTVTGINTVELSGTGYTNATLTPTTLTYANTTVGSSSSAQTLTLANTGKAVMTIASIVISGTDAKSYTDTTTCGATLAVAATCTIAVTFKPTVTGANPATLTVTDNTIPGRQTVTLSGTGVAAAKAKASLTPTNLTFSNTVIGKPSSPQTLTLSNVGDAPMVIAAIGFAGLDTSSYSAKSACGSTLAAGATCAIAITFTPAAMGASSAALAARWYPNSGSSPILSDVTLTGTGVGCGRSCSLSSPLPVLPAQLKSSHPTTLSTQLPVVRLP